MTKEPDFDAVVIGAGISGLYQAYRLREMGYRVLGVEGLDDIGGAWHHNQSIASVTRWRSPVRM
ncbi:FAD-dependent oxidoreductase [Nocardioides gansuensis]|nr:FAD-dependent oxidoreductase [Nocardioides gansuensis]